MKPSLATMAAPFDGEWYLLAMKAVLVRPLLWTTALRQLAILARKGWWRRSPWLPLPDADYLSFRLSTAYGNNDSPPSAEDVISYLHWCKKTRQLSR